MTQLAERPNATLARVDASIMESVIVAGDLAQLSPAERVSYYMKVCESVGLNPRNAVELLHGQSGNWDSGRSSSGKRNWLEWRSRHDLPALRRMQQVALGSKIQAREIVPYVYQQKTRATAPTICQTAWGKQPQLEGGKSRGRQRLCLRAHAIRRPTAQYGKQDGLCNGASYRDGPCYWQGCRSIRAGASQKRQSKRQPFGKLRTVEIIPSIRHTPIGLPLPRMQVRGART